MFGIAPIKIVISGIDQFSSTFRNAAKDIKRLGTDIDQVGRSMMKMGLTVTGIGLGLAHATGLTEIPQLALESQHALRDLGNVGGLTTKELAGIGQQMNVLSRDTNQLQPSLLAATRVLVASGIDLKDAMGFLPAIGKAATAEQADITDLARVSVSAWDNMGIAAKDLGRSLDIMTKAGKLGRFELADMAREFPSLTAAAAYLGIKGPEGIAKMSAALQVAVKGAADPKEAATNFHNFLTKVVSQKTMDAFMKIPTGPINLVKELNTMLAKKDADPIRDMILLTNKIINEKVGGKAPTMAAQLARTTFLFHDQELLGFIKAMVPKLQLYEKIKRESLAADGEAASDYKNMMTTLIEQWKQFKIGLATTIMPKLAEPLKRVGDILSYINVHQDAINKIAKGIIGMVAVGAVLTVLGGIAGFVAAVLAALSSSIFWIVTGIVAFGIALMIFFKNWNSGWAKAFNIVMLFVFPIGGVALIMIRHWSKLLPFFKLLWIGIVALFKVAVAVISFILKPVFWVLGKLFDLIGWIIDGFLNLAGAIAKLTLPAWLQKKIGLQIAFPDRNIPKEEPTPFTRSLVAKKDQVDVHVKFANAPKGTEVKSNSTPGVNFDFHKLGMSFGSP